MLEATGQGAMPRGWRLGLCVALFGVMALDGTQALLYDMGILRLYTPNLYLRLGTRLASGVGIAMVLVPGGTLIIRSYSLGRRLATLWATA